MGRVSFVVALSGLLCFSTVAKSAEPELDARALYDQATSAFDLGDFPRAIQLYKAAYGKKPDPALLYNIAQSYRLANDLAQSAFFYKSYLRKAPNAPNRREVEERIRKLEAQVERQHEVVTTPPNNPAPPGSIPTRERAEEPTPTAEPPASPPGVAAEPAHPAAVVVVAQPTTASDRKPLAKKWWLWTAVGGAVVAVGLGVGLGLGLSQSSAPSSHLGTTDLF